MTLTVTVLVTALPFLGVIVTVTLQLPAFTPFTAVPSTRQYFALDVATLTVTLAPDTTVTCAPFRIDVPVRVFPTFTLGEDGVDEVAAVCGVVAGGDVTGDVVCAATVVAGSELLGTDELLEELLEELDDELLEEELDEELVVAAARVTAMEYVVVDAPDTPFTAKEMFSVDPSATLSVSVSEDRAIVPKLFVRLIDEPDVEARTVKSTEAEPFGMLTV